MKKIRVVAAIIERNQKIFCAQRTNKGELALKWEFPGGKIELGETDEEALKREIYEELDSVVVVKEHFLTVEHQYKGFHLTMSSYMCQLVQGELTLNEHVDMCWLERTEVLRELDWAAADIPIVEKLIQLQSC
jgi:8-oxo-dGTP diphosphatase